MSVVIISYIDVELESNCLLVPLSRPQYHHFLNANHSTAKSSVGSGGKSFGSFSQNSGPNERL